MIGELPTALVVGGRQHRIRTNFRDILRIIEAFCDPELAEAEKALVCLKILYEDFENIPQSLDSEALQAAVDFIDCKAYADDRPEKRNMPSPRQMDWEQDSSMIFAAINRVAGREVRHAKYLHWWTFMGYYMEIPMDGVYGQVLQLRHKKIKNEKLSKSEQEFWSRNQDICVLRPKLSAKEKEEVEALKRMLDG